MLRSFFALAAQSPGRQQAFRQIVLAHLLLVIGGAGALHTYALSAGNNGAGAPILGHLLLISGIVEGAMLIGWRLTQLPKSQALEFLLVSPLRPQRVFLAEALVGITRLAWVTLAGLPGLVLLLADHYLEWVDILPLLLMPFTWGCITGLGLTAWAYEPLKIRRWFERFMLAGIALYLGIGVFVGENLRRVANRLEGVSWGEMSLGQGWAWGEGWTLPSNLGQVFLISFEAFHRYNPFAVIEYWLSPETLKKGNMLIAQDRMVVVEIGAAIAVILLLARAAFRLKGHFHERHYSPAVDESPTASACSPGGRAAGTTGCGSSTGTGIRSASRRAGPGTAPVPPTGPGTRRPACRWPRPRGRAACPAWRLPWSSWQPCPRPFSMDCGTAIRRIAAAVWNCCS